MGVLTTPTHITDILEDPAVLVQPRVFVELGTFEGRMAAMATQWFPSVYTVEMSPVYYAKARMNYPDLGIHFYHGDSRRVLPNIVAHVREPIVFYHDAHWWPHPNVADSFPLWDDLRTMATHKYADIVIVDEVHRFGAQKPTPHWAEVSLEKIA